MDKPRPFGVVVRDLLIERGMVTAIGNPNWAAFALELPSVKYESLRKAVTGERDPGEKIMEEVADALGVDPMLFSEYQLLQARNSFDPSVVGDDEAYANLVAWQATQAKARPSAAKRRSPARRAAH